MRCALDQCRNKAGFSNCLYENLPYKFPFKGFLINVTETFKIRNGHQWISKWPMGPGRCPPKAIDSTGKLWFEMMEKDKRRTRSNDENNGH